MPKKLKNYTSEFDELLASFNGANDQNPSVRAEQSKFIVTKDMPPEKGRQAQKQRQERLNKARSRV